MISKSASKIAAFNAALRSEAFKRLMRFFAALFSFTKSPSSVSGYTSNEIKIDLAQTCV